jgi:hypothetical protein
MEILSASFMHLVDVNSTPAISAATEEWTGAGAAVTKTITVS